MLPVGENLAIAAGEVPQVGDRNEVVPPLLLLSGRFLGQGDVLSIFVN
jgi:hypothetical protein